jgi:glutathione synthase/RimK-type ligase-like ATP-grasp enzyme
VRRVLGYRFDLNDSVASSIAQDKVATYQMLEKAGLPAVPHVLVRTKVSQADQQVMSGWQQIVIKPLVGTSGHGVRLFDDTEQAVRHIEQSKIAAWAAAPFVDIKREVRVIMLDGKPLLTYEKQPVTIRSLKMFNLGLGATPKDIDISPELQELASKAQQELGLRLSTVDIIEDWQGEYRVLEINDSIMMEHYMRQSPEHKERGRRVYDVIVEAMFK